MITVKWLFEPIYKTNYYFIVCPHQGDFVKTIKRDYNIELEQSENVSARTAMIRQGNSTIVFVWVKNNKSFSELGHELIHVITFLFDGIDSRITFDNSEPVAYLFQYLYEQFMDKRGWKIKISRSEKRKNHKKAK